MALCVIYGVELLHRNVLSRCTHLQKFCTVARARVSFGSLKFMWRPDVCPPVWIYTEWGRHNHSKKKKSKIKEIKNKNKTNIYTIIIFRMWRDVVFLSSPSSTYMLYLNFSKNNRGPNSSYWAYSKWFVTLQYGSKRRSGRAHSLWMPGNKAVAWRAKTKTIVYTKSALVMKQQEALGLLRMKRQKRCNYILLNILIYD